MYEFQIIAGDGHPAKIRTGAAMLLRIGRFISIYLTGRTLSLMLCALLAGCLVLRLSAKATAAVSIKRSEHLTLDGTKMYLLTRGADRSAPMLLWLHGGPGGAERPLFRYFNSELENHFVVVYWDQRGGAFVRSEGGSTPPELLGLDLARSVPSAGVPVLFFLGRYDRHTDGKLAATYFATLRAPVKRLVWFEKSAHNVPFEEPRLFNATVVRELQSIGVRLAAGDGVQRK